MATSKATIVSQPRETGVGYLWQTQVIYAVDFLKKHAAPIRLEDLAITSGIESLLSNQEMLSAFRAHERVVEDLKTGLFSYKPDFILTSPTDLLALLRRYTPGRGGIPIRTLRESWPQVSSAIEELEREGKVLVTRTGAGAGGGNIGGKGDNSGSSKEGVMKAVFLDEVGKVGRVDREFRDLWDKLKTPLGDELVNELQAAGLSTSSSLLSEANKNLNNAAKGKKGKRKGPGSSNRKFKITNVHLGKDGGVDLSKDYVRE